MQIVVANITAWLLLVMGLSLLVNPAGWQMLFADVMERPQRAIPLFLFLLFFGLFIISQHNIWRGQGIVVSLVGWATVIKATLFLAVPQWMQRFHKFARPEMLPAMRGAGVLWIAIGVWLVFF